METRMTDHPLPERRAHVLTEDRVAYMIEEEIEEALKKHDTEMRTFIKNEFGQLHALISAAFPNGDVHGHKLAHEKQIEGAKWWSSLKADFISKAFTTGLMAAVFFVCVAVWESVKNEVKK